MASITTRVIDPRELDSSARLALLDQLYAVHCRIFDGVSRAEFARHVIDAPGAFRTRVQLVYASGSLAGYSALHMFRLRVEGRSLVVLRGESGLLPEYRGRTLMSRFWIDEIVYARFRSWRAPVYAGCFVHPSAYLALGRLAPQMRPRPGFEDPATQAIADALELSPSLQGVRWIGWKTRESAHEKMAWELREDPLTEFYLRENPRYSEGFGLPVSARLGLRDLFRSLLRLGARTIRRAL